MRKLLPRILESTQSNSKVRLELLVEDDIEYFEGHFDGFAILPGVALIGWISHFGAEYLGTTKTSRGLDAIKFLKPILPNSRVHIEIEYLKEKASLSFVCANETEKMASGRILLGDS